MSGNDILLFVVLYCCFWVVVAVAGVAKILEQQGAASERVAAAGLGTIISLAHGAQVGSSQFLNDSRTAAGEIYLFA